MQKHRLVSIGIAVLAVLQGVFGVLRAFAYFRIGGELAGQGIILIHTAGAFRGLWQGWTYYLTRITLLRFCRGSLAWQALGMVVWTHRRCI